MTKINTLPSQAKVKIYWDDTPINYSKEGKLKIRNQFANKYRLNKNNVKVIYRPVKVNTKGETINISGAGIDNIMDVSYQRSLMKDLIVRDGKNVDFNRILDLDTKINSELNVDLEALQHRTWSFRWIMINNFLSFGENNYLSYSKLKGLTIVNSEPENTGGKTTLTIDVIKFLLHGVTTKTDKNEQIFNLYSGKNELTVRGMMDIEGEELIIERKLKRSLKKAGGWNVTNVVSYYRLLPDGTEEQESEEDAKQTTKKIKESIGSEKDFELLVLSTEKNLDDLIGLSTTDSGKLLSRLIGLEILELKEEAARKMYNEFAKKKKSNEFDVITLLNEIDEHKTKNDLNVQVIESLKRQTIENEASIIKTTNKKEELINSKPKIDVMITAMNPSKLEVEIVEATKTGKALSAKITELETQIAEIGVVKFDEDDFDLKTKELNKLNTQFAVNVDNGKRINNNIEDLIANGICKSCNRKLDTIDNTEHIAKLNAESKVISEELGRLTSEIATLTLQIELMSVSKKAQDNKNKLELDKSITEVEINSLRNDTRGKLTDLKQYNLNLTAIELNKKIEAEIEVIKTELVVLEHAKSEVIVNKTKFDSDVVFNSTEITRKEALITILKKEEEIEKIFKAYIELVGKKGISKLVLRSVLPIINAEVQRLLDDVCDFEIEIFINDKNDVEFLIIDGDEARLLKSASGLEKTVSSIALRAVLGKLSTLPMPNFISFDEVFGKVAAININKLEPLFDKIKDMYDIVFLITHNELVKGWSDNIVTVVKENRISRLSVK